MDINTVLGGDGKFFFVSKTVFTSLNSLFGILFARNEIEEV